MNSGPQGIAPPHASSLSQPEAAVLHFLKRLKPPCRLLVAYSGGGDSTGLLVALAALHSLFPGIVLQAATVDHGLRPGSDREAVEAGVLCARLGVPHRVLAWEGVKPRTGIQAAARAARYRLLADHALSENIDFVLTAHNLDDQRETLAMRRARDPAASGGIAAAVLVERSVWVVRPLLDVGRSAIRDYLHAKGIGWIEDPSNDNPAFERVRIRQAGQADAFDAGQHGEASQNFDDAALYIHDNVKLHPGLVAELDLASLDGDCPAHRVALLSVAAMLGGRIHAAGKETAGRILDFLAHTGSPRFAAERVVFERRAGALFIGREARGLPTLSIGRKSAAIWDGRFHIENNGTEAVVIGAGDSTKTPLITPPMPEMLPKSVRHRAEATLPRILAGDGAALQTRIMIPQFEHFLPATRLVLANSLAKLAGLEHFPSLSLG